MRGKASSAKKKRPSVRSILSSIDLRCSRDRPPPLPSPPSSGRGRPGVVIVDVDVDARGRSSFPRPFRRRSPVADAAVVVGCVDRASSSSSPPPVVRVDDDDDDDDEFFHVDDDDDDDNGGRKDVVGGRDGTPRQIATDDRVMSSSCRPVFRSKIRCCSSS